VKRSLSLLVMIGFLLVTTSGCASKDYVRQQIEPLLDRISKSEAVAQDAKKTAEEAKKTAEEAKEKSKECCEKAEGAANRAEAAARKAEMAAEKSTKSFELQQRK
jgi:hypothetical protein